MSIQRIMIIGVLTFLFGCKHGNKNETLAIDGETLIATEGQNVSSDFQLADLSAELVDHLAEKLKEAEGITIKYRGELPKNKYDATF